MNPFDHAARFAVRRLDPEGFLRWLVPSAFARYRFTGWLDTQTLPYPGEPDRRIDTVAAFERLDGAGPPVAAVIECQSQPQGDMLERLAEYALPLRRGLPLQTGPLVRYEVVCAVLNLTGPSQADVWVMEPDGFDGLGLRHRVLVRAMREQDAAGLLAAIDRGEQARCLQAWIPLMHGGGEDAIVAEWKRLASAEPDERKRGEYAGLVRLFADLADCFDVWKDGLKGWNMQTSRVVEEWRAEGRVEGEETGRAKGRIEGLVEGKRAALIEFLEVRFGESAHELVAAVSQASDPNVLSRWFTVALTGGTLEEIRKGWNLP